MTTNHTTVLKMASGDLETVVTVFMVQYDGVIVMQEPVLDGDAENKRDEIIAVLGNGHMKRDCRKRKHEI